MMESREVAPLVVVAAVAVAVAEVVEDEPESATGSDATPWEETGAAPKRTGQRS